MKMLELIDKDIIDLTCSEMPKQIKTSHVEQLIFAALLQICRNTSKEENNEQQKP